MSKRVSCVDATGHGGYGLTGGKQYDVIKSDHQFSWVMNDYGREHRYFNRRFKELEPTPPTYAICINNDNMAKELTVGKIYQVRKDESLYWLTKDDGNIGTCYTDRFKPCEPPVNPKAQYSNAKVPLHLWPATATALGCMTMQEGADKYGRNNFRATNIEASTYMAALGRHALSWWEGEDIDPDSGLPHLAKMLACIAIVVDAHYAGTLVDDRQFPGGYHKAIAEMQALLPALKERNADKTPKHYVIGE
jgi:hypothetical protein